MIKWNIKKVDYKYKAATGTVQCEIWVNCGKFNLIQVKNKEKNAALMLSWSDLKVSHT